MKTSRQFLMILAGVTLLSIASVRANENASSATSGGTANINTGNAAPADAATPGKSKVKPPKADSPAGNAAPADAATPGKSKVKPPKADSPAGNAAPANTASSKDPGDKPAAVDKPEEKKPAGVGVVNWILLSLVVAGLALAGVILVFIIKLGREQQEIKQRVSKQAAKSSELEKIFGDKLKNAIEEAVREKNPILRDYEELRDQTEAAQQALGSCQNELAASRSEYDIARSEVARLTSELTAVRGELETLQQSFNACTRDLEASRSESELRQKTIGKYELIIGRKVLDVNLEIDENDPRIRSVVLGLAKMNAMRDAGVDGRTILREFQSFDTQLNAVVRDQEELQIVREGIRPFVEKLFNNEYRISWPKIGANIADYSRNDELDLGESESGTTIKAVKCATIRFAATDSAPFQKAKVICD